MKAESTRNVYINCPFDDKYQPLLRTIVFAVVDCGFNPRCALERADASEVRISKIYQIISECRLGIHDLSRVQVDDKTGMPRFNMPFELGIFLGAKFLGASEQRQKACLVFDEHPHRYRAYLSDMAGQDIEFHQGDPRTVLFRVRDWLASMMDTHSPSRSVVWDHYETFLGELRERCAALKQRPEELTYSELVRHVVAFRQEYKEELDVRGDKKIQDPNAYMIKQAIRSIRYQDSDPFVILGKGANGFTFIQASMDEKDKWVVEYQDGHLDLHFKTPNLLSTDEVVRLFIAYSGGEEPWRDLASWKQIDITKD